MKERPILFNAPMVRSVLSGVKRLTRRVMQPQPRILSGDLFCWRDDALLAEELVKRCPYGQPGGRLWVRESFQPLMADDVAEGEWLSCNYRTGRGYKVSYPATDGVVEYYDITTDDAFCDRVTPSIHMPRWASRITLEITGVRVERLQDISIEDAKAEGAWGPDDSIVSKVAEYFHIDILAANPRLAYRMLWEQINGAGSWDANPWVWVIAFMVMK